MPTFIKKLFLYFLTVCLVLAQVVLPSAALADTKKASKTIKTVSVKVTKGIKVTNKKSTGKTLAKKTTKKVVAGAKGTKIIKVTNKKSTAKTPTKGPAKKAAANVSIVLNNAKFNGLTEIEVDASAELKGIAPKDIVITAGSYTVPAQQITKLSVENDKLTIDLDPTAFSTNSSVGATIACNAFGTFSASNAIAIAPSSDPLDASVWSKLTDPAPGDCSVWHNLTTDSAVKVDPTPYTVSSNGPIYKQIGKLKALMIVIDFPDAKASDNTGVNGMPGKPQVDNGNRIHGHVLKTAQDYYDYLMPNAHAFYDTSSYGQLDFDVTLVKSSNAADGGVFTCSKSLYGNGKDDPGYALDRGGDVDSYLKDALTQAKSTLQNYPGGPYNMIYVVAAENAVGISYGPTDTNGDTANTYSGRTDFTSLVRIGYDSYSVWKTKAVNHETGHSMGLVDYYINGFSGYGGGQCDPNTGTADYYPMVGHWNIMGFINGPAPDFFAYDKWRYGWIRDDQVDIITANGTTTHQLTPVETPGGTKLIVIPGASKGIAYVMEYRQVAGVDNTAVTEKSTDSDPNYQNENWKHNYGTFNSPGILMYKIDDNVDSLSGPLTIVDLHPDDTKELGTSLDSSVLGATSGIYTYTDAAAGITVTLNKETNTVDTLTVTNNPPATAVKPVLSEARFIDLNTVEFKTNLDLRGIDCNKIVLKKGNTIINSVKINQITPKTIRITCDKGEFANAAETLSATVSTNAFSFFGASDAVNVSPLAAIVPVLSEAKFNSSTVIQVKSNVDLTGFTAANIAIKKADSTSYIDPSKITSVKFDPASMILTITTSDDQFITKAATAGVTIATTAYTNYVPAGRNLDMAKFNPKVIAIDPSKAVHVNELESVSSIAITTPATKTIYAVGDTLNISGMVVTGTYSDGSHQVETIGLGDISGFDNSKASTSQTLTVTYEGKTATYTVAVTAAPNSIAITTPATKTVYTGEDPLDISGMVVTGTFSDGSRPVTITPVDVSGFDSSTPVASQVLTVTYGGKTATYTVTINPPPPVNFNQNSYYKIVNKNSRGVIDGDGGVQNWWDYTTQYDPTAAEWKFIDKGNNYYEIFGKSSSKYFVVTKDASTGNEVIQLGEDSNNDSQCWIIQKVENGYVKIVNKSNGKVLEVIDSSKRDGAAIVQGDYTGADNQLWKITEVESDVTK